MTTSDNLLIVSAGLRTGSRTTSLARAMHAVLSARGTKAELIDLSTINVPQCDGAMCYGEPTVRSLAQKVRAARAVLLCFPIYNYQANAATKNFVELTNDGWKNKVVAFAATAGSDRSFLAPLSLATSLMVDYRCLVVPRFVCVTTDCFAPDGTLISECESMRRLNDLAAELLHLAPCWPRVGAAA